MVTSFDSLLSKTSVPGSKSNWTSSARLWISKIWNDGRKEAWKDIRSIRWRRLGLWLPFLAWVGGLLYFFSCFFIKTQTSSGYYNLSYSGDYSTGCRPDDSFSPFTDDFNWWASDGFFQITWASGSLTFTQAKVIDIAWDVVIGRLGQTLLAFISYKAISNYVASCIVSTPVTYATFLALHMEKESSIFSLYRLIRDFCSRRALESRRAMAFIIISIIFTLLWPTLAGSMTGYTPTSRAFMRDYTNNLVQFDDICPVPFVVHDGERINKTNEYVISYSSAQDCSANNLVDKNTNLPRYHCFELLYRQNTSAVVQSDAMEKDCGEQLAMYEYVSAYGSTPTDKRSKYKGEDILAPTLNISSSFADYDHNAPEDQIISKEPFYMVSGTAYKLPYLVQNGTCQPDLNENGDLNYQWGFSFLQAFIAILILLIWTAGTYLMWLKAHFKLPLLGYPEVPQGWRCVMLLGEAIRKELVEAGIDPHSLTDKELKAKIQKHLQGGSVKFDTALTREDFSFRRSLWNWCVRHRWWCAAWLTGLAAMLSIGLLGAIGGFVFFLGICAYGIVFELPITLLIFKSPSSRLFMAFCFTLTLITISMVLSIVLSTI